MHVSFLARGMNFKPVATLILAVSIFDYSNLDANNNANISLYGAKAFFYESELSRHFVSEPQMNTAIIAWINERKDTG